MTLNLRTDARWELVSLGEIMLRLDPGFHRIADAATFEVYEGGGEYNVAKAMAKVFGRRTAHITALPEGALGDAVVSRMRAGGVDDTLVRRVPRDPLGRDNRVGLNFTERGHGSRASYGLIDRAHSAASAMAPGEINWNEVLPNVGWLHVGGVFASLSADCLALTRQAMDAAQEAGVPTSFDPNYRPSLWEGRGGVDAAKSAFADLSSRADVLFGVAGFGEADADAPPFSQAMPAGPSVVAAPLRGVVSASLHRLGGYLSRDGALSTQPAREIDVLDRIGSGDGFAAGVIEGILRGESDERVLARGIALAELCMSTPGDTAQVSAAEVDRAIGGDASVDR